MRLAELLTAIDRVSVDQHGACSIPSKSAEVMDPRRHSLWDLKPMPPDCEQWSRADEVRADTVDPGLAMRQIVPVSASGVDHRGDVITLCPDWHLRAHFGDKGLG